jgi:hypothetical protein
MPRVYLANNVLVEAKSTTLQSEVPLLTESLFAYLALS